MAYSYMGRIIRGTATFKEGAKFTAAKEHHRRF
jgi:hypothetical protein